MILELTQTNGLSVAIDTDDISAVMEKHGQTDIFLKKSRFVIYVKESYETVVKGWAEEK